MEPRLRTAVDASLQWYDDVFEIHAIPTARADGLWFARGEPPRWHSVAKTLEPTVSWHRIAEAAEPFGHCSVADSFGTLDLTGAHFEVLFEATWVHHPPLARPARELPAGWSVVTDADDLDQWNSLHDTTGVLVPALLTHPRFTFLAHRSDGVLTGGAVVHGCSGEAVGLSNVWTQPSVEVDVAALLACVAALHPARSIVDYAWGEDLDALVNAGFTRLGPQVVWAR